MSKPSTVLAKRVESQILLIRGLRVILDTDLAELYGVELRSLNQQVKRNARRFHVLFFLRIVHTRKHEPQDLNPVFLTAFHCGLQVVI